MKKLKLSIDGLKNQLDVMSAKELNSIAGGTYGGSYDDWSNADGFLNNVNGMISAGMFNYNGTDDYYGEYNASDMGSGFSLFGSLPNFNYGSSPSTGFFLNSGRFNGSGMYIPGSAGYNWSSGFSVTTTYGGFQTIKLGATDAQGRSIDIGFNPSTGKITFGIKIKF